MSHSAEPTEKIVVKTASGSADELEITNAIATAWRDALDNPTERAEIATLLGADETELDPASPPFSAAFVGSGTFLGGEILIALAVGFTLGFAKEFGKGVGGLAGKQAAQALRNLWTDHIRDRVSPLGSGRLGHDKEDTTEE